MVWRHKWKNPGVAGVYRSDSYLLLKYNRWTVTQLHLFFNVLVVWFELVRLDLNSGGA